MAKLIESRGSDYLVEAQTSELPNGLLEILNAGVVGSNGVVLLTKLQPESSPSLHQLSDLTSYESAVNHVHIEDYLSGSHRSWEMVFVTSLAYAFQLKDRLAATAPQGVYQIITSFHGKERQSEVRFVKLRSGQNLLVDDLEKYDEAIMILEADTSHT